MTTGGGLAPLMADPERFVAVLDADGAIEDVNDRARTALGSTHDSPAGKRFWALPWSGDDQTRRDLQRCIRDAGEGAFPSTEATLRSGTTDRTFELRFLPKRDSSASVTQIVVEGHEIAERERLAAELRASEELHRVTLNNMTDTVLITNDEGEFTYVCPNVHFIFGYTVEEIYEFGTIEGLLGEGLVEQIETESTAVQTNIECTATDKHGTEHTLLVNYKQVSIQDGTQLYSCRDITKRKQREVALSQLHGTTRELLYAETYAEVATQVVSDAADILPSGGVAVYRFDDAENVLYPIAVSDALQTARGPIPEVSLEQAGGVATAFVDETTQHVDLAPSPFSSDRTDASVGDYVAVPLGDHGVLLASATATDAFDTLGRELTELLAATTEAAFDRIARENELRERDSILQAQNEQLTEVKRVSDLIREIDQELVHAESRTNIEDAVCSRLTTDDRFSFAWISGTNASRQSLQPRAWGGNENGYLDTLSLAIVDDPTPSHEPTVRAAKTREPTLVDNTAAQLRAADWCREAVSRNFHSALAIPLVYDDVLLGTLSVYADSPDAFGSMVEEVLIELGETIASAINAVQRKEALHTRSVVELEYRVEHSNAVFERLATDFDCELSVEGAVPTSDDTTLVFVTVTGARFDAAATDAGDGLDAMSTAADTFLNVVTCDVIRRTPDGGSLKLELRHDFIANVLSDHGATLERLDVDPDSFELVVDVPKSVPPHSIDEVVTNTYPDAELVAQRERVRSPDGRDSGDGLGDQLTDRQREVVQVAYHSGFFAPDRDLTGRDIAAILDISHTAFYDHVRRAEQKLFSDVFDHA